MKRLILIFAGLLLAFSVSAQYRPQEASFSGTAADGAIIYYDNSTGLWSIASVSKILWDETNNELDLGASTKLIFGTDVTLVRNAANVLDLQDKFLLSYGSQDYLFTDQGANLALQSQTTATDGFLDLFTKDGDGTDNLYLEIYGVGLPTDVTNREKILIGYNNANQFEIFTEESGTGVGRDMVLFTEKADGSAFNTNQLVLATDGNVGIGTTNPGAKLDVTGSGVDDGIRVRNTAANDARITLGITDVANVDWYLENDGAQLILGGGTASTNLIFRPAESEAMRITNTGNVGIGTASPATTLDVAGVITTGNDAANISGQLNFVEDDGNTGNLLIDSDQLSFNGFAGVMITGDLVTSTYNFAADGEASDTYVITLSPAPAAYTTGMMIVFTANTANTDGATVNVNGLGARAILKMHDQALATGDVEAGQVVVCVYDGTNMQMTSQIAQ